MKKNENQKEETLSNGADYAREDKLSELEILKQSLEEQKNGYLSQILRLQADFENYRKRTEREKGELIKYGRNLLITEMIEIYETVQLARKMIQNAENNDAVLDGLEHIEKKVSEILKQNNVTAVQSLGKKFDTLYHEVVGVIEKDGAEDGTIIEEVRPGYKIDDRVLRTAMVKIAKSQEKKEEKKEAGENTQDDAKENKQEK